MTSQSRLVPLSPKDLADFGFARVRTAAFQAVWQLWKIRKAAGMKQADVAAAIGRDEGWLSRNFKGPGNWTFRIFGALVEALKGEVYLIVVPREQVTGARSNFDAYRAAGLQVSTQNVPKTSQSLMPVGQNLPFLPTSPKSMASVWAS